MVDTQNQSAWRAVEKMEIRSMDAAHGQKYLLPCAGARHKKNFVRSYPSRSSKFQPRSLSKLTSLSLEALFFSTTSSLFFLLSLSLSHFSFPTPYHLFSPLCSLRVEQRELGEPLSGHHLLGEVGPSVEPLHLCPATPPQRETKKNGQFLDLIVMGH
jgi:hypothetical protein